VLIVRLEGLPAGAPEGSGADGIGRQGLELGLTTISFLELSN
jgi:hypothetical protein